MITDEGFLLQAVNNDKQGMEIGEVFFFFQFSPSLRANIVNMSIFVPNRMCCTKEDEIPSLGNILSGWETKSNT